jgi:GTP-binding protein HflX
MEEDKLFATLDPTTRNFRLPNGQEILLTDTVGFIRKLPHHLIDAFRSTLEEAKYADVILHVVDSSNPQYESHMEIVYETLNKLGINDKEIITFFNKQDKLDDTHTGTFKDERADYTAAGSIKTGEGVDRLLDAVEKVLSSRSVYVDTVIPYSEAGKIQLIRQYGQLVGEEYEENGIHIKGSIPKEFLGRFS